MDVNGIGPLPIALPPPERATGTDKTGLCVALKARDTHWTGCWVGPRAPELAGQDAGWGPEPRHLLDRMLGGAQSPALNGQDAGWGPESGTYWIGCWVGPRAPALTGQDAGWGQEPGTYWMGCWVGPRAPALTGQDAGWGPEPALTGQDAGWGPEPGLTGQDAGWGPEPRHLVDRMQGGAQSPGTYWTGCRVGPRAPALTGQDAGWGPEPGTYWTGCWVGPRASLDLTEHRKITAADVNRSPVFSMFEPPGRILFETGRKKKQNLTVITFLLTSGHATAQLEYADALSCSRMPEVITEHGVLSRNHRPSLSAAHS
jgi:hypothetical protein